MFYGTLTIRMHCNWPELTVQQMFNEAWLFTFGHWTHGCDISVVKNYLNDVPKNQAAELCMMFSWKELDMRRFQVNDLCFDTSPIASSEHIQRIKNIYFYFYYWECDYVKIGSASSNYTIFGFCYDSLNSVTFS